MRSTVPPRSIRTRELVSVNWMTSCKLMSRYCILDRSRLARLARGRGICKTCVAWRGADRVFDLRGHVLIVGNVRGRRFADPRRGTPQDRDDGGAQKASGPTLHAVHGKSWPISAPPNYAFRVVSQDMLSFDSSANYLQGPASGFGIPRIHSIDRHNRVCLSNPIFRYIRNRVKNRQIRLLSPLSIGERAGTMYSWLGEEVGIRDGK